MLEWILSPRHIESLLIGLAIASPAGAALWAILRKRRAGAVPRSRLRAVWIFAFAGPLLWTLWKIYNAIMDAMGLDSLAGMGLNALIFIAVGTALGLALRGGSENTGD
ncbi:MAG: hypothetical protein BWZ10_00590 [candidate division BRC1 bacterium ADurb.BinA364]|nr:MAG: hypothetical protein BWZ10_00590 [candidate division BRC1 bacterium ADurb.BinA364]